jgi:hypothetical protein
MDTQELQLKAKLYQKLWAVMGEVDFIAKDGKVQSNQTNYKYATEAAIKEAVHPALVKHRLVFMPLRSEIEGRQTDITKNKFGDEKKQLTTTIRLHYRFVDIDTGYSEDFEIHGDGQDSGDKGIYKAFTGAFKYIFHMGLVIPTGDDPEKQELSKEERKQARADGHAQQQQIAERKIAQINQPQPEVWDWRIALPKFEQLEKQYGPAEVATALKMAGFNSLEETPNREAALTAYEKVRKILAQAPSEQPSWVEKPHKPAPVVQQDPAQKMLERMSDFKSRLAVIQQFKFDLVQKFGQKDGEERYYAVLDKISGHIDTHANEIARNQGKATHCASELYFELHPEAVEVSA